MRKYIRALEIPIYLFVIALIMFEKDIQGIGIFLIIVSIIRLIINVTFDDSIYKN